MSRANITLEEALARLKKDRLDEHAWGTVYDRLAPRARVIAYRLAGGDTGLAEDAVQDALEGLVRRMDFQRMAGSDDLIRYFSTMVSNALIDAQRKRRHREAPPADDNLDSDMSLDAADPEGDPLTKMVQKASLDALYAALRPRDRSVLTLIAAGYSGREVAARLGAPELAVRSLLHRIRKKLRDITP